MEFKGIIKDCHIDNGIINITLETKNQTILEKLEKMFNQGKELIVTLKNQRKKRSNDSNSYAWALIGEIAEITKADKNQIYLTMLDRYGVFSHIIVKPNVIPRIIEEFRLVKDLGEITFNGKTGHQLQIYFGSSTYDQTEMNKFVNGIVMEARDLGIPTLEDREIEEMNAQWGR